MSGGVDSSVSAYLLQQQGYQVVGIFMQNWEGDNDYCTIKEDSLDAIAVADLLGIEIEIVNFAQEYKERVFSYFLTEYQAGRTPNPDVLCNSEIKFKAFLDHALHLGASYIATGHYVSKVITANGEILATAADSNKDQSYFLYRLNQKQIQHAVFPLAAYLKPQIREIAAQLKLPNAQKKDSTGICFIGEQPFRQFLQKFLPTKAGKIITPDGKIVGEHLGLMYYTIGQRKGLGIGGQGEPWFVAGKNLSANQLIVVQGHNHPLLFKKTLRAQQLNFALGYKPAAGCYSAKTRYRSTASPCFLNYIDDETIELNFTTAQWAITPGQSVVIYADNLCLGGGIII